MSFREWSTAHYIFMIIQSILVHKDNDGIKLSTLRCLKVLCWELFANSSLLFYRGLAYMAWSVNMARMAGVQVLVLLLAAISCVDAFIEGLYCGRENCYESKLISPKLTCSVSEMNVCLTAWWPVTTQFSRTCGID